MSESPLDSGVYSGHSLYRVLTALCVALLLAFAWQLVAKWDWGTLLFLLIAAWTAVRCAILMSSKIMIAAEHLRVQVPLRTPREVEFRQLAAVHEEGRGLKRILLLYHPRNDAGIVTTDVELTLELPAVNDHDALLAVLLAKVPI
jgi:hypothetical protein